MSANALVKTDFDKDQMAVIEAQFFPAGATKVEQQYCFAVAKELGLNPITREIHFVPRRSKVGDKWVNKVEPMVGRDGFLSIAHRSGQLAGIESNCSIRDAPQLENGKWVVKPELVAECTVWRKDSNKPFTVQVAYSEYCQKTSDGSPTKFWNEKPKTMLTKTADSQALRKAFNIHGAYCPEELGAGFETESGEIITQTVDAEFSRVEPDKTRLSIVVRPPPEEPALPVTPPTVIEDAETEWPDPPAPVTQNEASRVPDEIISMLEANQIPYELDLENGVISATSYKYKDLLKANSFRWSASKKSWELFFEPDPF